MQSDPHLSPQAVLRAPRRGQTCRRTDVEGPSQSRIAAVRRRAHETRSQCPERPPRVVSGGPLAGGARSPLRPRLPRPATRQGTFSMDYRRYFDDAISKLKSERRYRVFADLERDARTFPQAVWHGPRLARGRRDLVLQRLSLHGPASRCHRGDDGAATGTGSAPAAPAIFPAPIIRSSSSRPNWRACTARTRRSSSPRAGFPISRRSRRSAISCRIASSSPTSSTTIR